MKKFYWTEKDMSFEAFRCGEGTTLEAFRCGDCFIFEDGHMLWREWFFGEDTEGRDISEYRTARLGDKTCRGWVFRFDEDAPSNYLKALAAK